MTTVPVRGDLPVPGWPQDNGVVHNLVAKTDEVLQATENCLECFYNSDSFCAYSEHSTQNNKGSTQVRKCSSACLSSMMPLQDFLNELFQTTKFKCREQQDAAEFLRTLLLKLKKVANGQTLTRVSGQQKPEQTKSMLTDLKMRNHENSVLEEKNSFKDSFSQQTTIQQMEKRLGCYNNEGLADDDCLTTVQGYEETVNITEGPDNYRLPLSPAYRDEPEKINNLNLKGLDHIRLANKKAKKRDNNAITGTSRIVTRRRSSFLGSSVPDHSTNSANTFSTKFTSHQNDTKHQNKLFMTKPRSSYNGANHSQQRSRVQEGSFRNHNQDHTRTVTISSKVVDANYRIISPRQKQRRSRSSKPGLPEGQLADEPAAASDVSDVENALRKNVSSLNPISPASLFEASAETVFFCKACRKQKIIPEETFFIYVEVNSGERLSSALRTVARAKEASKKEFTCPNCEKVSDAVIWKQFTRLPLVSIMRLSTFAVINGVTVKIKQGLRLPLDLSLHHVCRKDCPNSNARYFLTAFVVHVGKELDRGHYYTYAHSSNGCYWIILNDEVVRYAPKAEVDRILSGRTSSLTPYLLFYVHRSLAYRCQVRGCRDNNIRC